MERYGVVVICVEYQIVQGPESCQARCIAAGKVCRAGCLLIPVHSSPCPSSTPNKRWMAHLVSLPTAHCAGLARCNDHVHTPDRITRRRANSTTSFKINGEDMYSLLTSMVRMPIKNYFFRMLYTLRTTISRCSADNLPLDDILSIILPINAAPTITHLNFPRVPIVQAHCTSDRVQIIFVNLA